MELSKCLGCMDNLQAYPCPHCGYDPATENRPEYALPRETILAGKYLVGRVLGQGGFGITYIGWDIALERKVAIKEYYPSGQVSRSPGTRSLTWYTNEPALQAREDGMGMFLKEARKMSKVDDISGIVRVQDLFQENGTAYIVMNFVEGETLKARLQRTGPMSWEQAKDIFLPAIRAMGQVHREGLIHRDLSPDNLMLTPSGDVKILDLGAAKDLSINSGASSRQVAKSGFSPLEQYIQRGGSGPWTDVYSMSATIYYTLTGKLPPNAIERLDKDTLSWEEPGLQSLSPAALKTLRKALVVQSGERLQTMEELEEGLFSHEKPKKTKKSAGNPWIVPAATLLCVLGIVGSIVGMTHTEETPAPQAPSVAAETVAGVSSSDSVPLVAGSSFRSKDGRYSLFFEENGNCRLESTSGKHRNGTYTQDGSQIRILLDGGTFRMEAVVDGRNLQVDCRLFSQIFTRKAI